MSISFTNRLILSVAAFVLFTGPVALSAGPRPAEHCMIADKDFFATLEESRKLPEETPRTIVVRGRHLLTRPIILTRRDSNLTLRGEDATFDGGLEITEWKKDGPFLAATLPEGARPRMVVIGGRIAPRAVWPPEGTLRHESRPQNLSWMSSSKGGWNRKPTVDELTTVKLDPKSLPPDINLANAEITLFHSWDESTVPVKTYDARTGEVVFESPCEHPAGSFDNRSFVILNTREGLTRPGQWYFDRKTRTLVCYPPEGANEKNFRVYVSCLERLMLVENATGLTIDRIAWTHCNTSFATSGLRSINMPGTLEFRDVSDLTLRNLTITAVAGHGVKILRSKRIGISHCQIRETGAGGIFTHEDEDESIADNYLIDTGRINSSSVALHAGGKSQLLFVVDGRKPERGRTQILRNRIDGAPYCGITCNGGPHLIEGNIIGHCMRVLNDGACVYCSRAVGTVMKDNLLYDTNGSKGLVIGYYYDEDSKDCVLENNRAIDVDHPFHTHMTHGVLVRGNRFYSCRDMQITLARSDDFRWEDNYFESGGLIRIRFTRIKKDDARADTQIFADGNRFTDTYLYSATGVYLFNGATLPVLDGLVRKRPDKMKRGLIP